MNTPTKPRTIPSTRQKPEIVTFNVKIGNETKSVSIPKRNNAIQGVLKKSIPKTD